jgi:stage V sporulation protein B
VPATFAQIIFPIFADFHSNAPQKLTKSLSDALRVMALISFPLAIGTAMLAPEIIAFLYPADFRDAALVLRIIILGNAIGFLSQIEYTFLLAMGKQIVCMIDLLLVAVTVTIASLLIVPQSGYPAVAIIFMMTDSVLFASLTYLSSRNGYRIDQPGTIVKILMAAGLMGMGLFFIRSWPIIFTIPAGGLVYLLIISQLKVLGDQEKEIFNKLMQRRT